jgi:hypothetical protein
MAHAQASQTQENDEDAILDLIPDEENIIQSEDIDLASEVDNAEVLEKPNNNRAIIFVMSGLHKGAGCPVLTETTIGSDFNNDLILTDEDVLRQHLILTPIEDGLNYGVQVTCKGDTLVINGEVLLTSEQTILMQDTFVCSLGMVNLNITIHKASKISVAYKKYVDPKIRVIETFGTTTKKYLSPNVILSDVRNIILLALFFMSITASLIYFITRPTPKHLLNSEINANKNIKSLTIKETSNSTEIHTQAKNDLEYILQKYDLKSRLDLFIKENIIYVKGNINHYELQNWSKVLNWFDTAYSSKVNLVSLITLNNGLRRTISFKAIVADGSIPYVVSWTGDRFKPGATLPGGWIILKISDEGVIVKDAVDNRVFLVNHIRSQVGQEIPDFTE